MFGRALHALLIVALAVNGWMASSARVQMGMGSLASDHTGALDAAVHAQRGQHPQDCHGQAAQADAETAAGRSIAGDPSADDCCDRGDCHCGCLLPPALLLPMLALVSPRPTLPIAPPATAALADSRLGPPLRPPAAPV